jgi:hypothetical protein
VRVSNIVVRDLKYEAVAFDLHYTAAPQEPVSERTPRVRNIHVSSITGTARGAGLLFGLEESPLDGVTLADIDLVAEKGLVIRNADHVSLHSVRIQTMAGPSMIADGARDIRLFDVGTLAPHVGTAAVELGNVQHAFIQGCFASPGSESFLSVRGRDTREIIVGENDLGPARMPVVVGADVDPRAVQAPAASRR